MTDAWRYGRAVAVTGTAFRALNSVLNAVMVPLVRSPLHRLVSSRVAMITYTGRRSGRTFSTPVAYDRIGDEVMIDVAMADQKSWWRNFDGDGGPLTLTLAGVDHQGHAVAHDNEGRLRVTVTLTD